MSEHKQVPGGFSGAKPATEEIQQIVDGLKSKILATGNKSEVSKFQAVSYKSQVVAGTNFHIKIDAGEEHVHARVFRPLPCNGTELELKHVEFGKAAHDEL